MATFLSDQLTKAAANPIQPLFATDKEGRVRIARFSWTGDAAQNDLVNLVTLPPGSTIVTGAVAFTAFGAGATLDIGNSTTENKYLSAGAVAAAGVLDFAHTALLFGVASEVRTAVETVVAKFEAANPASGSLNGYVLYVVD